MELAKIIRCSVIDGQGLKCGVRVLAKKADGSELEMVVSDPHEAGRCMDFDFTHVAIDKSGTKRLVGKRSPSAGKNSGAEINKVMIFKTSDIDAMAIAEALMRALRDDPNFRDMDPETQADVLAAAAAAAVRALRAARSDVDAKLTDQPGQDASLSPRSANAAATLDGKVLKIIDSMKPFMPEELERTRALAKMAGTTDDYVLLKRLTEPDRCGLAGGIDALLKNDYHPGNPSGRREDDIVTQLTGAVRKAHEATSLEFSALTGGSGGMPMTVNRMLADFQDSGREELVQKIANRGRVGVELHKLLN